VISLRSVSIQIGGEPPKPARSWEQLEIQSFGITEALNHPRGPESGRSCVNI